MSFERVLRVACCVLAWAGAASAQAAEALAAVAANMAPAMERLVPAFSAATGHRLKLALGATGKFHAQIRSGAPFDLLLAADAETPRKLQGEGHALAGSAFTYAIGQLVLWSPQAGLVDPQGAVLAAPGRFVRLAIANPRIAPYGAAALQVLKAKGLHEAVAARLVTAESIGQAYQFVSTGNAELGFVALSQVMQDGRPAAGSMWRVPASLHDPLRQDAVLLQHGANNAAARAFLAYLQTPAARATLRGFGYGP